MIKSFLVAATLAATLGAGMAQTAAPAPNVRLRGTVERTDGSTLVMKERSGETFTLTMVDDLPVSEVKPIALSDIKAGSYVGSAALPQPDGTQLALEVLVFPDSARGTGEGHYPWDLQPESTMTNATVADLAATAEGRRLTLRYKDGEKVLVVPSHVPVVTFVPAGKELLVPGAKVVVTAQMREGKPTALRILAGRNGFAPPM